MSTLHVGEAPPQVLRQPLELDQSRGRQGMLLFIATEASLFVMLFFAYFFLAHNDWQWTSHQAPPLILPGVETAVMIASAILLRFGQKAVSADQFLTGRLLLAATILLALGFLVVQSFEYITEFQMYSPRADAYGSIFFTITILHACHVILGILMMGWVLALPGIGRTIRPPHQPYADVALYWYFVAILWVVVFFVLYAIPNTR